MSKLFDHHNVMVRCQGHHVDPIDAVDHKKIMRLLGSRRNLLIGTDGKNPKIAERFGSYFGPGLDHRGTTESSAARPSLASSDRANGRALPRAFYFSTRPIAGRAFAVGWP